jgi:hypothetical protein
MGNENLGIIVMIKKLFPHETGRVETNNFEKIIKDAEEKASGEIKVIELNDVDLDKLRKSLLLQIEAVDLPDLDERLKKLLGEWWTNGLPSSAKGSGLIPENKNKNYKFTWKVAFVLAMQNPVEKR